MSARAQDQVARLLALVPYLRERDGIAIADVARDFDVTPAQIVKDLNVLWFCGLPNAVPGDLIDIDMDLVEGEGIVKLTNADFLARPMRLAPHEGLALLVALRTLREAIGPGDRDAVDRALVKLEAAAADLAPGVDNVEVQIDDPVEPHVRAHVDEALRRRRRLHLRYYVPSRDETTERDVDPLRLVVSEGRTYLEAWCHRVEELRFFRLDRMLAADVLAVSAEDPGVRRELDLSRGLFQPAPDDPVAILRLAPTVHWVADYYPVESRTDAGNGMLEIALRYRSDEWLQRLVLRLGGDARIVDPPAAAEAVRRRASEALANYG